MSVEVTSLVLNADLVRNLKCVLNAYADAAEPDGTEIWPGWERVSQVTGYSQASVGRLTAKLLESGLLVQVSKGYTGRRATYLIDLERLTGLGFQNEAAKPEKSLSLVIDSHPEEPITRETLSTETKVNSISYVIPLPSYEAEESLLQRPKRPQIHRENFSAFYAFETGETYSPEAALTESEQSRIRGAAREATAAGITSDEIRIRGKRYREAWPTRTPTAQALMKWWGTFSAETVEAACRHRWEDGRTALFTVESTLGNYTRCARCPEMRPEMPLEPVSAPPKLRLVEAAV